MPRSGQERAAWRFDSLRYDAGYDCELPPDVHSELLTPKWPRILERHSSPRKRGDGPTPQLRWVFCWMLAIAVLTLVAALYTSWRQQEALRASSIGAISQPLTPQPTPTPASASGPHLTITPPVPRAVPVSSVPRAQLVRLPAPRAQVVSPALRRPPLVPGQHYLGTMPYGVEVLATFRGWLPSQDDLPSHHNAIGDMYVVQGVPFVWVFAPGATNANWIDP